MSERNATMTIYRDIPNMPDEPESEIEVDIAGSLCPAEPDVGIMSPWCEDVYATRVDDGSTISLTDREMSRAQELLREQD